MAGVCMAWHGRGMAWHVIIGVWYGMALHGRGMVWNGMAW